MSKKKILVFIDWYLPGYRAGGPIRSCANLIAHLSNEFDFFVVTRDTDYMEKVPYATVKKNEWNKLPDGSSALYLSKERVTTSSLKKIIQEVDAEIIYLNGIFSFYFTVLPLLIIRKKNIKVIVAVRGMLAPGALAIKALKKKLFLFISRMFGLYSKVIFQATNEEEVKQVEKYFSDSTIKLVPNLSRYNVRINKSNIVKSSDELKIISIARIAPEKNLLFALNVLKHISEKVIFYFYGSLYDMKYWEECKQIITQLPSNIKTSYGGVVDSEEVFRLLGNYHFLFLPSRGENFGHIILEAMSLGLPVIISDKTPWKKLEMKKAGWDLPLSNEEKFISIIKKCAAMNQEEYNVWSQSAMECASDFINDREKILANRQLFS